MPNSPEALARQNIDHLLTDAGWVVQSREDVNLTAGRGIAIREFPMKPGFGEADYLLYVDGQALGVVEAKKEGSTLTGFEGQTAKYSEGLPDTLPAPKRPLPFGYESTGIETRFTNLLEPHAASRNVFSFHRPGTLAECLFFFSSRRRHTRCSRDWSSLPIYPLRPRRLLGRRRAWLHRFSGLGPWRGVAGWSQNILQLQRTLNPSSPVRLNGDRHVTHDQIREGWRTGGSRVRRGPGSGPRSERGPHQGQGDRDQPRRSHVARRRLHRAGQVSGGSRLRGRGHRRCCRQGRERLRG